MNDWPDDEDNDFVQINQFVREKKKKESVTKPEWGSQWKKDHGSWEKDGFSGLNKILDDMGVKSLSEAMEKSKGRT